MLLTPEILLAHGYQRFHPPFQGSRADFMFQKKITEPVKLKQATEIKLERILYYIDIFQYLDTGSPDNKSPDGWQAEAQIFLDAEKSRFMNVTLGCFTYLDDIESFYAYLYSQMPCYPYENF